MSSCDPQSWVSLISNVSGGISFASWTVAQLPQLVETYRTKSVEGLSPWFICVWVLGDLCSFAGCVLTNQMFFQYLLAAYFLFNDFVLVGQYWYYSYYYKNHRHKHHHHHPHRGNGYGSVSSTGSRLAHAVIPAVVVATQAGSAEARELFINPLISSDAKLMVGTFFAWASAALYFFSRIPQLWKNYQRKSTEDISPFLFACTLIGNTTYATSILVSCDFVNGENRWEFFVNELPYMIGSAGTIVFDIAYFYQLYLYSERVKDDQEAPLLTNS